jgi:hypothetical protein
LNGLFRHPGLSQIPLGELDRPFKNVAADVFELSTAQIIDHPDFGPSFDQTVNQVRADEGSTSGN